MNSVKNILLFFGIFISCTTLSYSQKGSAKMCIDAEPLCGSTLFSYPNTPGSNYAEKGPDYGCLDTTRNPSWFYFQISVDGDIQLKISQSTVLNGLSDLDVDFVAYGPFKDPFEPCTDDLVEERIVDCGYEIDYIEYLDITNAKAGDYYILLITNYSREPGFITVEQTLGEATTNCNILLQPEIKNVDGCSNDSIILDATTNDAGYYKWYEETSNGVNSFALIDNANSNTLEVLESKTYKARIYDFNNVFIKEIIFNTNFYLTPEVSQVISDYVICLDRDVLITEVDLSNKNDEILKNLDPNMFSVSYYKDENSAHLGYDALPSLYTNVNPVEIIYARVENVQSNDLKCYDIVSYLLIVDNYPQVNLDDSYIICFNTNGTQTIEAKPVIDTRLNDSKYNFSWYLDDVLLANENNGFLMPEIEGKYSVNVTSKLTNCSALFNTHVIASSPPDIRAEVVSNPFVASNTVEVKTNDNISKPYEYRLDNGDWQASNLFYNVAMGEHQIIAKDILGCGQTEIKVMVMDYPLFFTPNGDGYNDTWNIVGVPDQWQAKVYIFDRYGKFIKQIIPNNLGWDGTLNGNKMPSDDYWFCIKYIKPNKNSLQTFKGHFALKR